MSQITLRHGIFLPPFHPMEENPTACLDRDLELIEWLDRLGYHEAWIGETSDLDRRAGRGGRAEIAQPHVAVLREFFIVGDIGVGLDDVGEGGAGGFEAGLDILPDLLDLGAHVALADAIAVRVAGELIVSNPAEWCSPIQAS